MTLGQALLAATRHLDQHHIPAPRLTAEVLLAHVLGLDRALLHARRDDPVEPVAAGVYEAAVGRRAAGEPLQYITGRQEFYGRDFIVDPSVLIPRPETELLVETVLERYAGRAPRVLDLCTGSGAIAVTLALELPQARVFASDVSFPALRVARANARRLQAEVRYACTDLAAAWSGPFDCVTANPPYVSAEEFEGLQREVRDHEPRIALVPEAGVTETYRRIIEHTGGRLRDGGWLVLEIGYSMEERIRSLFGPGWRVFPTRADLQGIPRVVAAARR